MTRRNFCDLDLRSLGVNCADSARRVNKQIKWPNRLPIGQSCSCISSWSWRWSQRHLACAFPLLTFFFYIYIYYIYLSEFQRVDICTLSATQMCNPWLLFPSFPATCNPRLLFAPKYESKKMREKERERERERVYSFVCVAGLCLSVFLSSVRTCLSWHLSFRLSIRLPGSGAHPCLA